VTDHIDQYPLMVFVIGQIRRVKEMRQGASVTSTSYGNHMFSVVPDHDISVNLIGLPRIELVCLFPHDAASVKKPVAAYRYLTLKK
jgi:hypothetical protein